MAPEMTPEEQPITQAAPPRAGGSGAWIGIAVLLGVGLGILGWQVVALKKQVTGLKTRLSAAQAEAGSAQASASTVAMALKPLARKSATAAMDYAAEGNAEEADECLEQAKELLTAVETMESCEVTDLRELVAEADIVLGGDGSVVAATDTTAVDPLPPIGGG